MNIMSLTENKSPNFSISYDKRHDILRLNNKEIATFTYDDYSPNIYLMLDEEAYEVIGVQIIDYYKNKTQIMTSIEALPFTNLKKAVISALKIIESNYNE